MQITATSIRLPIVVAVVMVAFASNSILARVGVFAFDMDPMAFATLRVAAGAAVLCAISLFQKTPLPISNRKNWLGAIALAIYMIGFSWSYLKLDAGLGALILFGVMQVAMFAFAVLRGDDIPRFRWAGAAVASVGLLVLLWPSNHAEVHLVSAFAMAAAGLGWGAYTLLGQKSGEPIAGSAANFLLCLPIVLVFWFASGLDGITIAGSITAVVSGAVTSGLGYALWYRVVTQLQTTTAAIAQLSVPVIAVLGGALILSEPITLRLVLAGGLVLGGISLSLIRRRPT